MAILRVSYRELNGVFRNEPYTMVLDVYLPDGWQAPSLWQGQIHVVNGDQISALEKPSLPKLTAGTILVESSIPRDTEKLLPSLKTTDLTPGI